MLVQVIDQVVRTAVVHIKNLQMLYTLVEQGVGNGRPGPIYHKLYDGYQRAKDALFTP